MSTRINSQTNEEYFRVLMNYLGLRESHKTILRSYYVGKITRGVLESSTPLVIYNSLISSNSPYFFSLLNE